MSNQYRPPSWEDAWKEGQAKQEERDKQRQAEIAASGKAWNGEGMALPPNDPMVARQKWEGINPGIPFPDDEIKEFDSQI